MVNKIKSAVFIGILVIMIVGVALIINFYPTSTPAQGQILNWACRKLVNNANSLCNKRVDQEILNATKRVNTQCDTRVGEEVGKANTQCDTRVAGVNTQCDTRVGAEVGKAKTECDTRVAGVNTQCDTRVGEEVGKAKTECDTRVAGVNTQCDTRVGAEVGKVNAQLKKIKDEIKWKFSIPSAYSMAIPFYVNEAGKYLFFDNDTVINYILVGGGGAGADGTVAGAGGGGGEGGEIKTGKMSLTSGFYKITVGTGGTDFRNGGYTYLQKFDYDALYFGMSNFNIILEAKGGSKGFAGGELTIEERKAATLKIHTNIIRSINTLIDICKYKKINTDSILVDQFTTTKVPTATNIIESSELIKNLLGDTGIKKELELYYESGDSYYRMFYPLPPNMDYFLKSSSIDRIMATGYVPSVEDVFKSLGYAGDAPGGKGGGSGGGYSYDTKGSDGSYYISPTSNKVAQNAGTRSGGGGGGSKIIQDYPFNTNGGNGAIQTIKNIYNRDVTIYGNGGGGGGGSCSNETQGKGGLGSTPVDGSTFGKGGDGATTDKCIYRTTNGNPGQFGGCGGGGGGGGTASYPPGKGGFGGDGVAYIFY